MEVLGKSPIPLPLLILAKITLFLCLLFPIAWRMDDGAPLFQSRPTDLLGLILLALGGLLAASGIARLGRSITVGLPTAETSLKTHGPYRFTRNPIYLGAFVACLGSFLYAPHPANLLLVLVTVLVHHWIILNEERFLEERFGGQWRVYKGRVHRYLGWRS